MAKIVRSDLAPAGSLRFLVANSEFELKGAKDAFETDDREILAAAANHAWLTVQPDADDTLVVIEPSRYVDPSQDPLSAVGPNAGVAFDPKLIREAEEAKGNIVLTQAEFDKKGAPKAEDTTTDTAIEAGKDQKEEVVTGGVAETVAADKAADTKEKK